VNERGATGVLLAAVAGLVLVFAASLGMVGGFLRARVEASAAADAAALAAAPVTFLPFGAEGGPRDEAARFAALNGAQLVSCACVPDPSWSPRTVTVVVARTVALWPAGRMQVRAESRAEFVPTLLLGDVAGGVVAPDRE
jgi:secretion/DNA translocation related TadE-like protein